MAERDKILRYYRGTEGAELAAHLLDLAEGAARNRRFQRGGFVDPYGYTIAETVAAGFLHVKLFANGGYVGAERQRVLFLHEQFRGAPDFQLACLKAVWNDAFYNLSHRDVLGALLGLGIKREVVGDILLQKDHAKIVVDSEMTNFILQNFTKIGSASISVAECALSEIEPKEERCKEIRSTVASMRLDSVASSGFRTSRSRIAADIAAEKVKVNWQPAKNGAQLLKEGDVISMRGRGRVEVAAITGTTKKGRLGILLKRYI